MLRNLAHAILTRLRHEPIAVWGVVIACALGGAPALGIPAADVDVITGLLTLAGVPVVRGRVTPMAALRALADGDAASAAADTTTDAAAADVAA